MSSLPPETALRSLMWRNTNNNLRHRWHFLALIGLAPLLAFAQTAPPAQPFQRLDGCAYKPQRWDDGDSFHVILPDQKELIFRLYFVDTPEEERVYADRIAEQAAYFGISHDAAIEIGREASEFTKQALTKPFTIYTRWRRALGRRPAATRSALSETLRAKAAVNPDSFFAVR